MNKRIVYIHKDRFEKRPPVISCIKILAELGYDVILIDEGVSEKWKTFLKQIGVNNYEIRMRNGDTRNPLSKLMEYFHFKTECKKMLSMIKPDAIWVEGHPAIIALGNLINRYTHILQIQELHETKWLQKRAIRKVIDSASLVFMPEYNRACLYQVWFMLKERPVVLPNKPYFVPTKTELDSLQKKYKTILQAIEGKRIVLYQGYIMEDRDISAIVKAVKNMGDQYLMLIVGKDLGVLHRYLEIDNRIVHIDYLPAPDYLIFTSLAYIGILTYTPSHLNNMYCAPNKIYEYGAFGLPMVGNDIPGLKIIEETKAGRVVDINDETEILNAFKEIENDHDTFSLAAKELYDKTDNKETIKKSLFKLGF